MAVTLGISFPVPRIPRNVRNAQDSSPSALRPGTSAIRQKPTLDHSEHAAKSSAVPVALQNNVFASSNVLARKFSGARPMVSPMSSSLFDTAGFRKYIAASEWLDFPRVATAAQAFRGLNHIYKSGEANIVRRN